MHLRLLFGLILTFSSMTTPANDVSPQSRDIESFWEYSDPAASEQRFRAALATATGDERLELLTQVARTHSLRKDFAEAHRQLDAIEKELPGAGPRPRIRYFLERGRTFNSAGDKAEARALFEQAWTLARASGAEGLAVDAAHMIAIVAGGTDEAVQWNRRGLEIARRSSDAKAKALVPAMYNNMAWDLHEMKRYPEALAAFESSLAEWTARGKPRQIQLAKSSVAQCLRSMGRDAEAARIEKDLEAEGYMSNPVPVEDTPQP